LLLAISIGLPVLLLALGIIYHGYVISKQAMLIDPLDTHVTSLATDHADELLGDLQRSMGQIREQLTQQRQSLSGMLSDSERRAPVRARAVAAAAPHYDYPATPSRIPVRERIADPTADMRHTVAQLAAEGLSDRAIARQLRVGLEEVRMTRSRTGSAS
jgi:hypothetical protein